MKVNTAEDGCNEAKCKTERDKLRDELKQQQEANDKLMAEREKLASQGENYLSVHEPRLPWRSSRRHCDQEIKQLAT